MQEKIGKTAGDIWHALHNGGGESTLAKLQTSIGTKGPVFDWAIGWLAREDKIAIVPVRRSFLVRLKGSDSAAAAA